MSSYRTTAFPVVHNIPYGMDSHVHPIVDQTGRMCLNLVKHYFQHHNSNYFSQMQVGLFQVWENKDIVCCVVKHLHKSICVAMVIPR